MNRNENVSDDYTADPITVQEVKVLAQKRLPKSVYDYYACGADDQDALRRNIDAFNR